MYGLQHETTSQGAQLLIVWSRSPDNDPASFNELRESLTDFLRKDGVPLDRSYLLDVYGPDGALKHRFDSTP
ncbi:hypothetical protein [Streptomyces sp. NPDC059009]|uniref:hypothetical protein n=1 Tax=Streptomyces sp. NPDC059009 TaxID=3346694 RepID=UPI00369CA7FE